MRLARGTYLDAWGAALFAGDLTADGRQPDRRVACRVDGARTRDAGRPMSCSTVSPCWPSTGERPPPRAEAGRRCVPERRGFRRAVAGAGCARAVATVTLWDFDSWDAVSTRQVELARSSGALALLSVALNGQGMIATWSGDFDTAAALGAEDEALKQATGVHIAPYGSMLRVAYEGRIEDARQHSSTPPWPTRWHGRGARCRTLPLDERSSTTRSVATKTRWPPPNTWSTTHPGCTSRPGRSSS